MRRSDSDLHRVQLSHQSLSIDFHRFIQLSRRMTDVELAQEFHMGHQEVELLRAKMNRN